MAVFYIAALLSGAFSGLLAYGIEKLGGRSGLAGWQWIFLIEGLVPVATALVIWKILPDSPETASFLTQEERDFLVNRLAVDTGTGAGRVTNQDKIKMKDRLDYTDHGFVFAKNWEDIQRKRDVLGDPLQMNNLGQRQFKNLIEASGVRTITFHGMRHTCATLALQNGTQPHVVQKMLGHKRIEITLGIYGHVLPEMKDEVAEKMSSLLRT